MGGHKPLKPIDDLVADCAKVLRIKKPDVFIRNDPIPQAYVKGTKSPHILVLTSGLLDLYDGAPEELRFVVGHEMGHIRCKHIFTNHVGRALVTGLADVDVQHFEGKSLLPTLALGRYLSWMRESEISADRAGLICCQDPQVAYNALARLQHGVSVDSGWPNPDEEDYDPAQIVKNFENWESRPFVGFLLMLKSRQTSHPFIPDRIAALYDWANSGHLGNILSRTEPQQTKNIVDVVLVVAENVASKNDPIDVYLKFLVNGRVVLKTTKVKGATSAVYRKLKTQIAMHEAALLEVEFWSDGTLGDKLVGIATLFPVRSQRKYVADIQWDIESRSSITRTGVIKLLLNVQEVEAK